MVLKNKKGKRQERTFEKDEGEYFLEQMESKKANESDSESENAPDDQETGSHPEKNEIEEDESIFDQEEEGNSIFKQE